MIGLIVIVYIMAALLAAIYMAYPTNGRVLGASVLITIGALITERMLNV